MEAPPPAAQPQHYRISQHHNHRPYGGGEGGGPVELTKEPSHSDSNNNDNNEDRCGAELRAQLDCNLTSLCDHIQLEGFNNGAFSDVIVQSMGSVYHLHRLILSRSSYFRNMLQGPWKEANAPVLTLHVDDNNVNGEAMEIALDISLRTPP
ncbi:BTB/POZ domain-containing protein [Abeliophyllum distichum]|uniref:BTB/POZ domain-containing protein n=1 Tax=Abeliophyllum distichum TaxID=126358 RepID=A0ABD1NRJ9_9LAMI